MRIEHLAYFREVAGSGSINKAAKSLFISQPALTAALNGLEEELGFKLFIRSYNGVLLTPNGERLLADAEQILAIAAGWPTLAEREGGSCDTVHIVANPAAYSTIIAPLVIELGQRFPQLHVFTYEAKNQTIPAYLENNEASIGIISVLPRDEAALQLRAKQQNWRLDLLLEDQCQLLISSSHPLAQAPFATLADLKTLNLAMYPEKDDVIAAPLFQQYFTLGQHFHLSNLDSILRVVAENQAVAMMPRQVLQRHPYVTSGQITMLEIADYPQPLLYYLLYRSADLGSALYQQVLRETWVQFQQRVQ